MRHKASEHFAFVGESQLEAKTQWTVSSLFLTQGWVTVPTGCSYHGQCQGQLANKVGLPGPATAAVGRLILFSPRFWLNLEFSNRFLP